MSDPLFLQSFQSSLPKSERWLKFRKAFLLFECNLFQKVEVVKKRVSVYFELAKAFLFVIVTELRPANDFKISIVECRHEHNCHHFSTDGILHLFFLKYVNILVCYESGQLHDQNVALHKRCSGLQSDYCRQPHYDDFVDSVLFQQLLRPSESFFL